MQNSPENWPGAHCPRFDALWRSDPPWNWQSLPGWMPETQCDWTNRHFHRDLFGCHMNHVDAGTDISNYVHQTAGHVVKGMQQLRRFVAADDNCTRRQIARSNALRHAHGLGDRYRDRTRQHGAYPGSEQGQRTDASQYPDFVAA